MTSQDQRHVEAAMHAEIGTDTDASAPNVQLLATNHELAESKAAPSTPLPIGTVVTSFPLSAFITAIILLPQAINKRRCFLSMAIPVGSSPGAKGHLTSTLSLRESMATTSFVSFAW